MEVNGHISGYAILAISLDGKKAELREIKSPSAQLESYFQDCADSWLAEDLAGQLPEDCRDALAMVFFRYQTVESGGWEYKEYDDDFEVLEHVLLQSGYKAFSQFEISDQITFGGRRSWPLNGETGEPEEEDFAIQLVAEWEEFYEEDFELHPRFQKKQDKERREELEFGA